MRASKNPRVVRGCVEDEGAGHLDLPHRGLPPVAGHPIGVGERQRQPGQPALHEHVNRARPEPVTDRLHHGRVVGGGEPVGQFGEPDTGVPGLAFGPFVAVEPHLGRVREVGAHLDECGTEVDVPQVEVVATDSPVCFGEPPLPCPGRAWALVGAPDALELLGNPDRGDSGASGGGLPVQVRAHQLELAPDIVLAEPHPGNIVLVGKGTDGSAEPVTELLEQRRGRERKTQVVRQERHHLRRGLQRRHIGIEIDPVQALDIQGDVTVQDLGHGDDVLRHDHHLPPASLPPPPAGEHTFLRTASGRCRPPENRSMNTQTGPAPRRSEAGLTTTPGLKLGA